jgi:cell division protein FtsB
MKRLIDKRYLVRQNLVAVIGICLSVYFSYHLVAGQRSLLSLMSLERQVAEQQAALTQLSTERIDLEKRVVMMRPGSIDRDLLEERVRVMLGYTAPNEQILIQ